jgi:hypothetical protein
MYQLNKEEERRLDNRVVRKLQVFEQIPLKNCKMPRILRDLQTKRSLANN